MERLEPRVRAVWAVGATMRALFLGGVIAVGAYVFFPDAIVVGVALVLVLGASGVVLAILHYRIWRYEIQEDALYIERGVFTRVKTIVPYVRVQHVDSQRGPLERAVGLASIVVYTAGSRSADVAIPGLTPDRADALQEELRRLAIRSEVEDAV